MSDAERKAYQRGYNAGRFRSWPLDRPPVPPDPVVARLVRALSELADAVDGELAKLDPADEWALTLGPHIDEARVALESFGRYVVHGPPDPEDAT